MEYSFYDFLALLGSLALFLYGMKIMSEGLQKFAGDRLRSILTAMTTNRVTGVLTGMLITALIQSSSATTVMVVSFVNAGLLTLSQSIGVIMGANIGTTVTAWIISALGFKVDISAFSLPLLAIGIPLLFSQKSTRKSVGEFISDLLFVHGIESPEDERSGSQSESGYAGLCSELYGHGLFFCPAVRPDWYCTDHDCTGFGGYHGHYVDYVCQRMD